MKKSGLGVSLLLLCAAPPLSAGTTSGAALAGYGLHDAHQYGVGVRGGFTFPVHLYVGGTIMSHAGRTGTRTEQGSTPETDCWYFGGEGGWDVTTGPVTVRPYLGVGSALVRSSSLGTCPSPGSCVDPWTEARLEAALWPGVALLLTADNVFIGADLRYVVLAGSTYGNALGAFGTLGLQL
jgi:hypothetical protein